MYVSLTNISKNNLEMWVKEPPPLVKGGPTYNIKRKRKCERDWERILR